MNPTAVADLRTALAALVRPAPGSNIAAALDAIEKARAALGPGVDPQLSHYLTGHSYLKALNWLEGRQAENAKGGCG